MSGRRPKVMEVHPSSKIWFFYDNENNLVLEKVGNLKNTLKDLEINWRNIKKFSSLEDCLKYELIGKIKYKVYYKLYYKKDKI